MLFITEQFSKVSNYVSSVAPVLTDSKVASVAVTALSLVASAFSYFTLPQVISYTLGGLSLLAIAGTTALFLKLHNKAADKAVVEEKAKAVVEEKAKAVAPKVAEEPKKAPYEPGFFARLLGYKAEATA
jgi:hypothetical protein